VCPQVPYCDFNSYAARGGLPEAAYVAALLGDLDGEPAAAAQRRLKTCSSGRHTQSVESRGRRGRWRLTLERGFRQTFDPLILHAFSDHTPPLPRSPLPLG
jgi:hypothetical protein